MDGTMLFNDKIIFLDDLSYIEHNRVEEKHPKKDSCGVQLPKVRYEITIYLKSNNRTITTWYAENQKEKYEKDYQELKDVFVHRKDKKLLNE